MKNLIVKSARLCAISVVTAMTFAPAAYAYDTDIYFSNASGTGGSGGNASKQPNILFILDTSGSMAWDMDKPYTATGPSRMSILKKSMNTILDSAQNVNVGLMRFSRRGGAVVYPVADINADAGLVELQKNDTNTPQIVKGPFTTTNRVNSSDGDAEELQGFLNKEMKLDRPALSAFNEQGFVPADKTVTFTVSGGDNDGEEVVGINRSGQGQNFSSDKLVTMVDTDKSSDDSKLKLLGLRFENLPIPQSATITSARISLRTSAKARGEVRWNISVDDDPQSEKFRPDAYGALTLKSNNQKRDDSFKNSGAAVGWTQGKKGNNKRIESPNIKELLQRVISNPAWVDGSNALSLFMWPDGSSLSQYRRFQFDSANRSDVNEHPRLEVSYSSKVPATTQTKLGLHFDDVRIPQGAKITSARLIVTAAQSSSSPMASRIYLQNSGNADAFSASQGNISLRPKTGGVNWNLSSSDGWSANTSYDAPDIKGMVQSIVDRNDWCGGNDMAVILEGTGDRKISSFDGDPANAPQLVISYENDFSGSDTGCTVDETSYQISNALSDADESQITGSVNVSGAELRLGGGHYTGLNFSGIRVPQGADIEGAYLNLVSSSAGTAAVSIRAHDADTSSNFSPTPDNISTRPRTSASKYWAIKTSAASESIESPDFSNVISEIVQRPGWLKGAGISLILQGQSGAQNVQSFEKAVFNSARLKLRYRYDLVVNIQGASGITVRQRLKQIVDGLPASGGTPATDTLYEAARYLRGDRVQWGYSRWNSSTSRTSIPASYDPLTATISRSYYCPGRDSDNSNCKSEYISQNPLPEYVTPIINSCQNTYVVLLSDGDPNTLYGEDDIKKMTGGSCPSDDDDVCAASVARYMNTKDMVPTGLPGDQKATVHTIRFAEDADPAYLKAVAAAGGGDYYDAPNEEKLLEAFNNIVAGAVDTPETFAAPSVALSAYNRLQTGNNLFYSMFMPHVSKAWGGNVKHYRVVESNDPNEKAIVVGQNNVKAFGNDTIVKEAQSFWSNPGTIDGDQVDSGGFGERIVEVGHAARKVYTYTGNSTPSNVAIRTNDNLFESSNNKVLSMTNWSAGLSDTDKRQLIDWARGKDLDDSDSDGSQIDTRWILGDPLHGQPVSITYDGGANADISTDDTVKIFIGTNAGFIHALDSKTGEELWSFIPPEMLSIQQDLRADTDGPHVYGVDGRVTSWVNDVNSDGDIDAAAGDKVILFVPFGRGARSLYALDVTKPDSPKIVWRIDNSSSDYANLGQTWSRPIIGKMQVGNGIRDVLVMGGGYDPVYDTPSYTGSASMGKGVYILDAETGKRIIWISDSASADLKVAGMNSAIPSDISAIDIVGPDRLIDRLYFGDLLGRLWRVDLTKVDEGDAGASVAHLVADLNGPGAEANRRFFNPPQVIPFTDQGEIPSYLFLLMTSGDIHNPLYKVTLNAAFAIKDDFKLLKKGDLPNVLTLVKNESDVDKGILDVTRYSTTDRPKNLPNGYYFNFVTSSGAGSDVNVGRVGLKSGSVAKYVNNGDVDYAWSFSVYDPTVNSSSNAVDCSSSVVGVTRPYNVFLKDGFPVVSSSPDCASCSNPPDERVGDLEIPGIAPEPTEASTDNPDDPQCLTVSGFTVITPAGEKLCSGANTTNTYWWRSR